MTIKKLYRHDLSSETVNLVGLYIKSGWRYMTEDIDIPQVNIPSDHAVVVGNGISGTGFDLTQILPYRQTTQWGETTPWSTKRQMKNFLTYGCNAIYRDYKLDFVCCTGNGIIQEIAESSLDNNDIVFYTNTKYIEQYPGKFSFLPQDPDFNSGAIAAYMAAFDGHKKVYMLGFDGVDNPDNNYNRYAGTHNYPPLDHPTNESYWVRSLNTVMQVYNNTEFVRVCPTKKFRQPDMWRNNLNYRQIDFRQFVLEADV